MRFIIPISGLLVLIACSQRIKLAVYYKEQFDPEYALMMEHEAQIIAPYLSLEVFHLDMMAECTNDTATPYHHLDSCFVALKFFAQQVSEYRQHLSAARTPLRERDKGRKRMAYVSAEFQEYRTLEHWAESVNDSLKNSIVAVTQIKIEYEQLLRKHRIARIGYVAFADTLNDAVLSLTDSLEEQGRVIGKIRTDLRLKFPEQKGDEFWKFYHTVSELELLHKKYRQQLMQLESAQSRFYEANAEEFFYTGPHMPQRMEVQAAFDLVISLGIAMEEFRIAEQEYRAIGNDTGN